jgi:hypothetical protein
MDRLPLDTIQCRERQGPATHARGPTITLAHVAGHGPACRPSRCPVSPVMASGLATVWCFWPRRGLACRLSRSSVSAVMVLSVGCRGLQRRCDAHGFLLKFVGSCLRRCSLVFLGLRRYAHEDQYIPLYFWIWGAAGPGAIFGLYKCIFLDHIQTVAILAQAVRGQGHSVTGSPHLLFVQNLGLPASAIPAAFPSVVRPWQRPMESSAGPCVRGPSLRRRHPQQGTGHPQQMHLPGGRVHGLGVWELSFGQTWAI